MKYHIKNKNNKKEMKKVRIKPLPLSLMRKEDAKTDRIRTDDERNRENPYYSEII